jgi:hypothetical protein
MNENGSFAVLSEIEGYKSLVSVFDTSFKESFKLYSAENYILSCDISPDNQNIAVTTLKADKANIEPGVSIYKIGNDKPFFTFAIAESAPFVIKYKSNGSFFVLTEKKAYFFSKDGKKHTEIDFEGRILQNFAYNSPRFTAFVLGEKITNKKTKIIIIDDEGNTITNQEINENVRFSSFSKSFLTLLLDNSLMLIDPYNKKSIVAKKNIVISPEINEVLISGNVGFLISGNYANIIAVE